jgi:hypothetical protein
MKFINNLSIFLVYKLIRLVFFFLDLEFLAYMSGKREIILMFYQYFINS